MPSHEVMHLDLSHQDRQVEIDAVSTEEAEAEPCRGCAYGRHQGAGLILHGAYPCFTVEPGEVMIDPYADTIDMPRGVVLATHVGIVDISDAVVCVKGDE